MLATVPEKMEIDPQTYLECWREVKYSHASDHALLELALMKQELLLSLLWLDWAMLARHWKWQRLSLCGGGRVCGCLNGAGHSGSGGGSCWLCCGIGGAPRPLIPRLAGRIPLTHI